MIANLLTALLGQRSSRRYVGRHRIPEPPAPADDDSGESPSDVGSEMITSDGSRIVLRPPTASV